eukprot:gene10413-8362_t
MCYQESEIVQPRIGYRAIKNRISCYQESEIVLPRIGDRATKKRRSCYQESEIVLPRIGYHATKNRRSCYQESEIGKYSIDPMSLPQGMDEEMEILDALSFPEEAKVKARELRRSGVVVGVDNLQNGSPLNQPQHHHERHSHDQHLHHPKNLKGHCHLAGDSYTGISKPSLAKTISSQTLSYADQENSSPSWRLQRARAKDTLLLLLKGVVAKQSM